LLVAVVRAAGQEAVAAARVVFAPDLLALRLETKRSLLEQEDLALQAQE
jgi:hypothetical protein